MLLFPHVDATHSDQGLEHREPPIRERLTMLNNNVVRLPRQLARWIDTQPKRALSRHHRYLALLLKGDHDHGEGENERLSRASESYSNHVPAAQGDGQPLDLVSN